MKTLALMAGVALIGLSGTAYAQDASATTEPVGVGTETGTDVGARTTTGVAGDTPTATSAAAKAGTNNSAGATVPTDATATAPTPADATASTTAPVDSAATTAPAADASASAATTATAGTSGASATVQSQWATYDKDSTGALNPLEFGTWVLAAQGNDLSKQVEQTRTSKRANLPAIKVLNATASEFSKADGDKDRAISPTELTTYLGG